MLLNLLARVFPQENDRQVVVRPRHQYEHSAVLHGDRHRKHHRTYGIIRNPVDSATIMYSEVLSDLLQSHNYYRARHSAPPLTIDQRLNQIAQKYAEYLAATGKWEHSGDKLGNESLGENLYREWDSRGNVPVSGRAAAKAWYDEIDFYSFKNPKFSEETGHFTQMIWKSSQKMGVGVALSAGGRIVHIVTDYYPAGNISNPGYFAKNVLPARR